MRMCSAIWMRCWRRRSLPLLISIQSSLESSKLEWTSCATRNADEKKIMRRQRRRQGKNPIFGCIRTIREWRWCWPRGAAEGSCAEISHATGVRTEIDAPRNMTCGCWIGAYRLSDWTTWVSERVQSTHLTLTMRSTFRLCQLLRACYARNLLDCQRYGRGGGTCVWCAYEYGCRRTMNVCVCVWQQIVAIIVSAKNDNWLFHLVSHTLRRRKW